jgi:arylsulfatase A-like enzyme
VERTTHASIAALIAALVLLGLPAAGCPAPGPVTTVSLADQLDPAEPPGPWRPLAPLGLDPRWFAEAEGLVVVRDGIQQPAAVLAGEEPAAIRALIRGGALIQTEQLSTLRLPVRLQTGQGVCWSLRYPGVKKGSAGPWAPQGAAVRLLADGEEGAAAGIMRKYGESGRWMISGPGEGFVRGDLRAPEGGSGRIEIVHRVEPGTPLKLLSIDMLVLDAGAEQRDHERARRFLELGGGDSSQLFQGAAVRRLVRVSRYGMTAQCAVLTPGDALEYSLPPGAAGGRLAFHSLRPPGDQGLDARLDLECETGGHWAWVTAWKREELPAGEWAPLTADLGRLAGGGGRVRLIHAGHEGAIGIAEPVLLPGRGRAPEAPNLVLVVLDTLRADRLGCYGYLERPTSERLDRTLEQWGAAVFSRAHSASPWTIPATAKFMSSRFLDFHGARQVPESTTMLAEFLRHKGYYCAAFTGGGMVAVPGMEQGFHQYRWSSDFGKVEGSFPQAGQWLREWDGGPFFLFVHTYETHRPYTRDTFCRGLPRGRLGDLSAGEPLFNREASTVTPLTGEERAYVQAAYDSGVYHACEATAGLLDILTATGKRRETVLVILSDHGEELWDHHPLAGAHGHSLHREMLDVPLIIHGPQTAGRGLVVIGEPVSTVDFPPTAADMLGIPWESGADGVSLRPLLTGGAVRRPVPILADLQRSRLHPEISTQACVIEGGIKYIEPLAPASALGVGPLSGLVPPTVPGLFRLTGDPGELENLAAADAALAGRMHDLLRRAMGDALQPDALSAEQAAERGGPLSEELENQLQALGYLAPAPPSPGAGGGEGN